MESFSSRIKDTLDYSKDELTNAKRRHGIDSQFEKLNSSQNIERKRRKDEYEQSLKAAEKLRNSGKL